MSTRRSREKNQKLIINEILEENRNPLSGDRLWAANIYQWTDNNKINLENKQYLTEIPDINKINKIDTMMIVKDNNIEGFGKHYNRYNHATSQLFFQPYISKENLLNFANENFNSKYIDAENFKIDGSYKFYKLNIHTRGGGVMKNKRKTQKRKSYKK